MNRLIVRINLLYCVVAVLFTAACTGNLFGASNEGQLLEAVKAGNQSVVRSLLASKTNANATQADGSSALAWATHRDDVAIAELLIQAGADVNAANDYGVTPLSLACSNRNTA